MNLLEQILPQKDLENLQKADQLWTALRQEQIKIPRVIEKSPETLTELDFDLVISGGTLGIFLGASLQKQGLKVALIEKGILQGRKQEWNISRHELQSLIELELITQAELEKTIVTEYNPARIGFDQGYELWVKDVLNVGVDPIYLLEKLKLKFLETGGILLEKTNFKQATICQNGVIIETDQGLLKSRLLIDAMGHFSPIMKQARKGQKPDGVCLVVGSCAKGFDNNKTGDLIYTFTPIENQCQYFWEAFPAQDGRTTYLFTYVDTEPQRFSLEFLMNEYLKLLPQYQKIALEKLEFQRFLFGFFPAYEDSPLKLEWERILPIGDSSGSQSPVSFGGFGSMIRHLKRLTFGVKEALENEALTAQDLALLQPYQPNIAVTWLFQKTMSVKINQKFHPQQINQLMSGVFKVMDRLGDKTLKPFLQDVIQFSGLTKTLPLVNPLLVLPILPQVGLLSLLNWLYHYLNLCLYFCLYKLSNFTLYFTKKLSKKQLFYYHRFQDAWQYGSGQDFNS